MHLFSSNTDTVHAASSVGSHFIVNNLLHSGFVVLFVRSHFAWAEFLLVVNFINLSSLYFRHNTYPRFIHTPVVSGPLAWTFVAIYWNGAIMIPHPGSFVARIFGNVFIWSILAYGIFFLAIYNVSFILLLEISNYSNQLKSIRITPWVYPLVFLPQLLVLPNSNANSSLSNGSLPLSLWEFSSSPPSVSLFPFGLVRISNGDLLPQLPMLSALLSSTMNKPRRQYNPPKRSLLKEKQENKTSDACQSFIQVFSLLEVIISGA